MLHWDRKYRAKFGFEFVTSTETWFSQKILDEVKARYENTLVVKLDIAAQEEFKLIEHGLEHIWERYLDPRFRRHPKLLERWFRIHWKKRTTSPPVALKKLILLDKMPRCCRMTSIKRRKRMIILIVECLLIRKIPGT